MYRRVFIVWSNPLFLEIVRLLLQNPGVDIVGASARGAKVQSEIEDLQPDTIVVEETEVNDTPGAEAVQILEASPWGPRVIRLSLEDNELWLYHRERRAINRGEDLLSLVLD